MVTKHTKTPYIYDWGDIDEAGGEEQHNITEAAPNGLKLAEGE